jgi:hypothetical protein
MSITSIGTMFRELETLGFLKTGKRQSCIAFPGGRCRAAEHSERTVGWQVEAGVVEGKGHAAMVGHLGRGASPGLDLPQ